MSTSSASTRERLVVEALALVDNVGVGGFTGREVARRAGVSHGAPRRYFETQAALLSAVASRAFDELGATIGTAMAALPGDAPAARVRLRTAALTYVEFARERPGLFELMFRHDLLAGSGEESLGAHSLPVLGVLRGLVAEAGGIGVETEAATIDLWAQLHGIAVLHSRRAFDVAARLVDVGGVEQLVERAVSRQIQ